MEETGPGSKPCHDYLLIVWNWVGAASLEYVNYFVIRFQSSTDLIFVQ